jgi:CRISPR-associated protein Csb3
MSRVTLPIDLANPGQVFAALGLVETTLSLMGSAHGAFDWRGPAALFHLEGPGKDCPLRTALDFLRRAQVQSLVPRDSDHRTEKWSVPSALRTSTLYPVPPPDSPAALVARLTAGAQHIDITHWGDGLSHTGRDNFKLWAGAAGYPGSALLRDALDQVRTRLSADLPDPFSLSAPMSSSFRLDPRGSYIPLNAGFSLNEHSAMVMRGYPIVEIFGAIGLGHARPQRLSSKLRYRYGVVMPESPTAPLFPPSLLRAALGGGALPFPTRRYTVHLGWPGQENQARAITATELES